MHNFQAAWPACIRVFRVLTALPLSLSVCSLFFLLLRSDVKQTVLVGGNELHHLYNLASLDDTQHNDAAMRRTAMHTQSQARYSQWSNTLEAQRNKKKQDRVMRLEAIEREQQGIDREEQAYQEAQRRVVLDRANRLLWQDTDKVSDGSSSAALVLLAISLLSSYHACVF